jgi:hypothetical protein
MPLQRTIAGALARKSTGILVRCPTTVACPALCASCAGSFVIFSMPFGDCGGTTVGLVRVDDTCVWTDGSGCGVSLSCVDYLGDRGWQLRVADGSDTIFSNVRLVSSFASCPPNGDYTFASYPTVTLL